MTKMKLPARVLCTLAALLLLAACGTDEGYRGRDLPSRPQTGDVQFVNLMPDSPAIRGAVGNASAEVEFGSASSRMSVVMGDYKLSISYVDADGEQVYIIDHDPITLDDEDQYVYLLRGSILHPQVDRVRFVDPQYGGRIDSEKFEVWFANALSANREVDLYLTAPDAALVDAAPLATVAQGGLTETFTLDYDEAVRLRVTDHGSTNLLYDSGEFVIAPGSRALLALVDYFGPTSSTLFTPEVTVVRVTPAGILAFADDVVPSQMRVINLVPDVASLDVYLGSTSGAPLIAGITPFVTTGYVDVKAGARALNVTRTGTKNQFVAQDDLQLQSGRFYSLVLAGRVANDSVYQLLAATSVRPIMDRVQVNFIHAAIDAGAISAYLLEPGQSHEQATAQFANMVGGSFRTTTSRPGLYDLVVTAPQSTTVVFGPERVEFVEGTAYSLVLIEDPVGGSTSLQLKVLEDNG